jgi:hypothetical protein
MTALLRARMPVDPKLYTRRAMCMLDLLDLAQTILLSARRSLAPAKHHIPDKKTFRASDFF